MSFAQTAFEHAYQSIDKETYTTHIKTLSSDEFGGRAPASEGEEKTIDYLTQHFKSLGLQPGNGNSFTQEVPLVSITATAKTDLTIGDLSFKYGSDFVVNSATLNEKVSIKNSELIFVGYGVVAPEYNWNDYAGIDVKGKTVVILVNDPGYATQNPQLFNGNAMTYYGRWTYKYEEAARQGAAAAIIVHETAPASYGWNVVESSWSGAQFHLPTSETNAKVVDLEMWLTEAATRSVFEKAGLNFDLLKQQAMKPGFKPVAINLKASAAIESKIAHSKSYNIMATIPGKKAPDEHILYTAHWDHLGTDTAKEGDQIYNGALDNATGTAALLMIAKAFKTAAPTDRSITFVAVAAEEQGLLGSKYYAAHPVVPLNKTVGVINMDSVNVSGLKKNMTVVGFNKSELQNYLEQAAKRQNRELVAEAKPERGGFYRSDHFSLAKKGVPAIYAGGGSEASNEEQAKLAEKVSAHTSRCYHNLCDEFRPDIWSLESAIADLQVFFETGFILGNTSDWPNYYEGTEFKAIRDASMK